MEVLHRGSATVFGDHLLRHLLRLGAHLRVVERFKGVQQRFGGQAAYRHGLGPHARTLAAVTPERLVAKERHLYCSNGT